MNLLRHWPLLAVLFTAAPPLAALDNGIDKESGIENLRQTGKAFAAVARTVSPSVVFIEVEATLDERQSQGFGPFGPGAPFDEDFFRRFFGQPGPGNPGGQAPPRERRAQGQGSGFVFASKDGLLEDKTYILTNSHVVQDAEKITVKFKDGRTFEAQVTGTDPKSDVAVIELDEGGLPALKLADSAKLEVGEWVVALGNPFGLSHTLTAGVVSATGRTALGINDYEDFIQTDAAINPGNSGGPLVNLDGEVVGINTAIFSRSGGYMGVGFAIPSNLARGIADQLIESGEVTRGYIGIVIQDLTPDLAESFDIESAKGIVVAQVSDGSPADAAGLEQGDVILTMNGEAVKTVGTFRNRVAATPPGTKVKLTVLRNGKQKTLTLEIGRLTDEAVAAIGGTGSAVELGLTVQTITPELAQQLEAEPGKGVAVTNVKPGSIAARAGIRPGAVILQVDRKAVDSAEAFEKAVRASQDDKKVLLLVSRGGMASFLVLSWE